MVEEAAPAVTPEAICLAVYLIGVGLVAGVMLWQVVRIRRLRRGAAITRTERFTLVRTPQRIASFSFFRSIYLWDQIPAGELQAIVAHEASHVTHRHSAERVAMECMKAALWWNPFVWLGRTAAHRSRGVRSRQRRAGRRVRHRTLHENHIQAAIRL